MVKISPSSAGDVGSIPGEGAEITLASWPKNIKQKQYCNKFNENFKNSPHQKKKKRKKESMEKQGIIQPCVLNCDCSAGTCDREGQACAES